MSGGRNTCSLFQASPSGKPSSRRILGMKRIFITGLSGTGKSVAIEALLSRGFTAIDTDYDDWCELAEHDGQPEWIWREERMRELLTAPANSPLFVSGCVSNQGKFYEFFDCKMLFSSS